MTGKNTLAGNPAFKIPGKVILSEPYNSIISQAAADAWRADDNRSAVFANSTIEPTIRGFKKSDTESLKVKFEPTLRGVEVSKTDVIHTSYNQLLNIPYSEMEKVDYIFVDEAHVLSADMSYRSDVITKLLNYLMEFLAKKQHCKTKIIFMSGTPSIETNVIKELMKEHHIDRMFQRIIVKKSYNITPIMHLTHLDTTDTEERVDAVTSKINDYIKQGRKVCHIFNNKAKMDQYIREIQSKLSPEIKVGLFYSGSIGECTNNILMGMFGKYDVVLATNFIVNGINIERDGLTEEDILAGKKSKQKYGVVIDLGQSHTSVNALDAIQTINRFRNRLCHSTVFLPKIFRPSKKENQQFDFSHTAKVLRGINKFNYHLLSSNPEVEEFIPEEEDKKEKMHLVNQVRKNPLFVSISDIDKASKQEADRVKITDMMGKGNRIYEDWYCSLEGYHFLAKDAGIAPIIKHISSRSKLEEMEADHESLENSVVENFLNNDEALEYLTNQIDPDKRILVKASDKVSDPESTEADNFSVQELLNDKYIVTGDFHSSHERALNYIIRAHLNFSYWYGTDEAMRIFRYLLDDTINMTPGESTHYTTLISRYLDSCKIASPSRFSPGFGYLAMLDTLSSKDIGIEKRVFATSVTYTIHDNNVVDMLMDQWAEAQIDMTLHKIDHSESLEKEELKKYYSNRAAMKEYDIESLKYDLARLGYYTPYKLDQDGNVRKVEEIHLTRVLRSQKLMRPNSEFDTEGWIEPPFVNALRYKTNIEQIKGDKYDWIRKLGEDLLLELNPSQATAFNDIISDLGSESDTKIAETLITWNERFLFETLECTPRSQKLFDNITSGLLNNRREIYETARFIEYSHYSEGKIHKRLPSMDNLFFVDSDFDLSDLDEEIPITKMNEFLMNSLVLKEFGKEDLPKTNPRFWVAFNQKGFPVLARKTKGEFCKAICDWAYDQGEEFFLSTGTPVKDKSKGIYKHTTFARDYLRNTYLDRKVKNYQFKLMTISAKDLDSLRK